MRKSDAPQPSDLQATRLGVLLAIARGDRDLVPASVLKMLKLDAAEGDERIACLIVRELNPAHVFGEAEEQLLRGVSDKTLKGMKDRSEVPRVLGSTVVPLQRAAT